jgi:glycosyltransferase involved in cell wall biosynthesis
MTESVSVVMAVRDAAAYVEEALTSIFGQSTPPAEVVVVDDGSTDATAEVVRRWDAVTLIRQPALGIAAALNCGVAQTRHGLVAFLDGDDLWPERSLELRVQRIGGDDEPEAVEGLTVQFVSPELGAAGDRFRFDPAPTRGALLGATLFRRSLLERVGRFDESVAIAAPVEWVARARRLGVRPVHIDEVVLRRRIHEQNLSVRLSEAKRVALLDVIRRHHRETRRG